VEFCHQLTLDSPPVITEIATASRNRVNDVQEVEEQPQRMRPVVDADLTMSYNNFAGFFLLTDEIFQISVSGLWACCM